MKIVISGTMAERYRAYRDAKEAVAGDRATLRLYREEVRKHPQKFDSATLAATLSGAIRFHRTAAARAPFLAALQVGDDAAVAYGEIAASLEAQTIVQEIATACERAGAVAVLADALTLLFIEAHPHHVALEEFEDLSAAAEIAVESYEEGEGEA
ncbi:hypothetical protein HYV74_01800 [Candidatus Uhrbacteria bacterium]|nr:hypothetical protein [Candidatus Uhrbacteria bacterium]